MNQSTSSSALEARLYRIVPALDSLRSYDWRAMRSDVIAGLTVAAVAVPQAMAYALVAGLPAQYGLYTAIVMTAVGAVFDSSRQLINGPTNAISIALLSAIAAVQAPEQRIQAAVLMAFMVGSVQLIITFLRLGDLTRYISHSVIVGFTLGASALLVLDQLKNLVGITAAAGGGAHDHFLVRFWNDMTAGGPVHLPTAMIGIGSIAMVLALRWIKQKLDWQLLPELLLTVVAMAVLTAQLGFDAQGVRVIGEIPTTMPPFAVPRFDAEMIRDLSTAALAIGVLGLLEAIAMAKAIAAHTGQRLDMNQQCLSEGLANFTGSFFQCMPGSGSLTRSAINQQAGAVTQWSGVVSAAAVATIMIGFGPYARFIPRSALAGILILTAWKMIDRKALAYHLRATRFDAIVVGVTAFAAVGISVEFCVLIGTFLSFMLTVPRAGRMTATEFVVTPDGSVHERLPQDHVCGRLLIFGLEGEMFFGASSALDRHFRNFESRIDPKTKVLVLRMKRLRNPDAVGLTLLEAFADRMKTRGVRLVLCGVRRGMYETMEKSGLLEKIGPGDLFLEQPVRETSTLLAIRHAYDLIDDPCETCPRQSRGGEPALYYMI